MSSTVLTGASSGIGRATAIALAKPGATIHLLGRDRARLAEVAARVRERGASAEAHAIELGGPERVSVEAIVGPVDALVHAAGAVKLGPLERAELADLDAQWRINARAPYALTQALLPRLVASRGQIVFVNSGAGRNARAGWGAYAMSKFALRALADALREELKPRGVRVISIYPGRTATPMQEDVHRQEGKAYDPGRFIQPDDVAGLIAHALSLPRTANVTELDVRHEE